MLQLCGTAPAFYLFLVNPMVSTQSRPQSSGEQFLRNVLWGWAGVLFSLLSGLLLSPYIIHHLGDERYGIWALGFSVVDYYNLVDFGFRSAVLKFVAHYRAVGDKERMEEIVSTALTYFSIAALILLTATALLATFGIGFFNVTPENQSAFRFVLATVGIGVALGAVFNTFSSVVEAHQRFDISSRIDICNSALRISGCFLALYLGFGIRALAMCILAGQILGYGLTYIATRRLLPDCHFSLRRATRRAIRQLAGYGSHTFMANTSFMVLNQDSPVLIGHFLSATWVAYFAYPWRLLLYSADLVGRIGMVTGSKSAELMAYGDIGGIARITVLVNRYCLTLFFPVAAYLSIFGEQLLYVWIRPEFARHSAQVLPWLGAGFVIAVSAGYNSGAALYGMAKQKILARAAFVEACLSVAGLWYLVPRYGIVAAAIWISILMIIDRGFYVQWQVARNVGLSFAAYMSGIFARPMAIGIPVAISFTLLNYALGRPVTWPAVLGLGAFMAAVYFTAVFFFGLEQKHRALMVGMARRSLSSIIPAAWGGGSI